MELQYTFDKAKYQLGTLCKHGHAWPGTERSLRRINRISSTCLGCSGRKRSDWLLSFLDYEAMGWPPELRLGKLCKCAHEWRGTGATLRVNGRCMECEQDRLAARRKTRPGLRLSPQEQRRRYKAMVRQRNIEQGLTTRGTAPVRASPLQRALQNAGRSPSVARLVMDEQLRHWRMCPKDRALHWSRWAQASWWLRYQVNPDLRLYHREKSKRRKAQDRGQTPVQIPVAALRQRFNEFGNCCAYCGSGGDMQIEHLEPISKGGAHDIGNIVPACGPCNTSKGRSDMDEWYHSQPFFSELRLRQIHRVMQAPSGQQLPLPLAIA